MGPPYGVDEWNRRRLAHTLLKTKTPVLGEARALIMGAARGNGYEAWRQSAASPKLASAE